MSRDRAAHPVRTPLIRQGQEEIVAAVLGGRDVLAVIPTGSGKSLGYQLPAVMLPGTTLVGPDPFMNEIRWTERRAGEHHRRQTDSRATCPSRSASPRGPSRPPRTAATISSCPWREFTCPNRVRSPVSGLMGHPVRDAHRQRRWHRSSESARGLAQCNLVAAKPKISEPCVH